MKVKFNKKEILGFLDNVEKQQKIYGLWNKTSKELQERIIERLTPEVGQVIADGTDLIMRLRLGQLNIVSEILKRNCNLYEEGRGPDIDGPLYKAFELGEYLRCLKDNIDCKEAKTCWVTRKGFCPRRQRKRK